MEVDGIAKAFVVATDALNRVTTSVYDGVGNLLSTKDALDNETSYTYDGSGNQLSETDALDQVTSWTYDARGNQLSETDAAGNVSTFTYDRQGSQLASSRSRTLPGGGSEVLVTSFQYDDLDRELWSRVVYEISGSDPVFSDSVNKLDSTDDVGEQLVAA